MLILSAPGLAQDKFNLFTRAAAVGCATGGLVKVGASSTLSCLAAGTNGYTLTMAGGAPGWASTSAATLSTTGAAVDVSGSAAPGGSGMACVTTDATHCTWQSVTVSGGSGNVTVNAKGAVQTYDTAPASLAVGVDGKVLTADSAAATGLSYRGGLVQISKITTAASQATVDFTSIPANYTDLVVVWQARSNVSGANEAMSVKFNNDGTSGNYTITEWWQSYATGSGTGSTAASATGLFALQVTGNTAPSSHAGSGTMTISNYLGTVFYKGMFSTGQFQQGAGTAQQLTQQTSGVWKNTAAVTRLTFSVPTSFVNGSVFTLYGVGTP